MNRPTCVRRVVAMATVGLALLVALASSSCNSAAGMGVGVGTPARWGGSSSSPPVFVGGPSYR
ncbi:MAG TPA: hypothetical protein VE379_10485 [Vicinamibacterales bacterium]|jgi:hypothetical protein|nr:hypothetical protein [Vicinamibacterales bacterium]